VKKFVTSDAYGKTKFVMGFVFIILGAGIVVQMLYGVGFHIEAVPGLLLGGAMFALGVTRVRAGIRILRSR
jgi:hypothetical protein